MIKKVMRKIINTSTNIKMYYKLMVFIILIGMLPVLTYTIVSYRQTYKMVEKELISNNERIFDKYIEGIKFKLDLYESVIQGIYLSTSVQKALSEPEKWTQPDVYLLTNSISKNITSLFTMSQINGIYKILIYSMDPNFPSDGQNISNISALKDEAWFDKIDLKKNRMSTFQYSVPGLNKRITSFVYPIISRENLNKIGILKVDILIDSLFQSNHLETSDENNSIYIFDKDNKLIYSKVDEKYYGNELNAIQKLVFNQKPIRKSVMLDNKDVAMFYQVQKYGWKIYSIAHYSSINKTLSHEKVKIFMLAAAVLIVIVLVTILFSKVVSKRLKLLYKKMIKVQNGNLEITERITGNDEIGEIDKYFSECIERIKLLIEQNYIAKLEKRDAELVALQLQINPHFLYNTLESINYIAEIYECSEISLISQKLGQMFRYILNKDSSEFVPLHQDLKHVMNYMEIQNIRFSNKFNIVTEINQELMNAKIIKFTLQPIIENSVKYAFSGRSGGTISISANTEESDLFITIEDNGIGIEPAYLEEVNTVINDMSFNLAEGYQRSIGLRNVNLRIKKIFGEEYGIEVFSKSDEGTRVICKLPYSEMDVLQMHTNYGLVN